MYVCVQETICGADAGAWTIFPVMAYCFRASSIQKSTYLRYHHVNPFEIDTRVTVLKYPQERRNYSAVNPLIFHIEFIKGGDINFYEPGEPIHSWFTNFDSADPDGCRWLVRCHDALLEIEKGGDLDEYQIGMPFRGFHKFDCHSTPPNGARVCRYSYLAIGVAKAPPAQAFIVRWSDEISPELCQHMVDPVGGRSPPGCKPVAFLAGWRRGTSSLGTVMAVSPGGNCIAAATWNRLLIWTFNAALLDDGLMLHYFPRRDYNESKGFGRLRPTQLCTTGVGVIYSLRWASEVSLFASTERGLVQWDMGIFSTGKRPTLSLD